MLKGRLKIMGLPALMSSVICLLLYLRVLRFDFINFDDPEYVLNNPVIQHLSLDSLSQAFIHSHVGWWMPLTWLSLAIDYHFWELNPIGYHLTNILLHSVNAGLVVLIADRILQCSVSEDKPQEDCFYSVVLLLAGLFFGCHPLRVESVAWVTERKDVLNGLFVLLSIFFYLQFAERKGRSGGRAGLCFILSLLCFACSLMAKSVSVVLPAMFLVLDWIPLGRLKKQSLTWLILEKWPFWLVSALMTLVTLVFAAQSRYLVTYDVFPFIQRVVVSGNAVWEYARMLILPVGLSPFNVIPDPVPLSYTVKSILLAIVLLWLFFSGKAPRLAACIILFLLPLLPVLAFFQNGDQSFADRFTYLPSLSPAMFLAIMLHDPSHRFIRNYSHRRMALIASALVMMVFMLATYRQQAVWKSSETFWSRIIAVEPLAIMYKERGRYYHDVGRYTEAVADYSAALDRVTPTLKPYEYNLYAFRAESLRAGGMFEAAVRDFSVAIMQRPHPAYYFHRGLALRAMGRNSDAEEDFRRAGSYKGPVNWFD
jgi:hypothetical protein